MDAICICCTIMRTNGAAGPSGLAAAACDHICTSFQRASYDLYDALSAATRRLCIAFGILLVYLHIILFLIYHLIELDKYVQM